MESVAETVLKLRVGAGLSQRSLARRTGTSQPAIARYEGGAATPAWETLQRIASACGSQLRLKAEPVPDPEHVSLALRLLFFSPAERLNVLRGYARLREAASPKA